MADDYPIEGLPSPDPSCDTERVVTAPLEALAANGDPLEDPGIGVAYNFASPANRRSTGPPEQFTRMATGPRYAPMVDHVKVTAGPLERDGDAATQRVTLTGLDGRTETYGFSPCVFRRENPIQLDLASRSISSILSNRDVGVPLYITIV